MWKFLKAAGKVIFYVIFSPVFFLLWLVDTTINCRSGGSDKFMGKKLTPGVRYFRGSNTFSITDPGAYFGSIPESRRRRLVAGLKELDRAEKGSKVKQNSNSGNPYVAGIEISKNGTSRVVDVGAYFGSITRIKEEELRRLKEK